MDQLNRQTERSLFHDIGGQNTVRAVVGALYFHILTDPKLVRFFRDINPTQLIKHQEQLFTLLMKRDNLSAQNLQRLYDVHQPLVLKLGLKVKHFDLLIDHLKVTLVDLHLDPAHGEALLSRVEQVKTAIFPGWETR